MTKILFKYGKHTVGITDEGKYFESYGNANSKSILDGAGLYIKELTNKLKNLEEICRNLLDDKYMRSVAESLLDIIQGE